MPLCPNCNAEVYETEDLCWNCGWQLHDPLNPASVPPLPPARGHDDTPFPLFSDPIPEKIGGWSWGAFTFGWLWGISNNVWISLWGLIPYVNIAMSFVLGFKGKEWAWNAGEWRSIEDFERTQHHWSIAAAVFVFVIAVATAVTIPLMLPTTNGAVASDEARCVADMEALQSAAYAFYYASGGEWPIVDRNITGNIQWYASDGTGHTFVPDYVDEIPSSQKWCYWHIDDMGTVWPTQPTCPCGSP